MVGFVMSLKVIKDMHDIFYIKNNSFERPLKSTVLRLGPSWPNHLGCFSQRSGAEPVGINKTTKLFNKTRKDFLALVLKLIESIPV